MHKRVSHNPIILPVSYNKCLKNEMFCLSTTVQYKKITCEALQLTYMTTNTEKCHKLLESNFSSAVQNTNMFVKGLMSSFEYKLLNLHFHDITSLLD